MNPEIIKVIYRINYHQKFNAIIDQEIERKFHLKCEPYLSFFLKKQHTSLDFNKTKGSL